MNPEKDKNEQDQYNILRAVFDQSFQFIGLMTLDGKLIDANRTAIKFAGVKEEDVIGKFFWETPWWIHSKELQEKLKESTKKAGQGEMVRFEATHPGPDGKLHNIDFSLKPVRDEKGKVIYLIPEGRDITEMKKIEEELRESEEKCKSLFDNAKDGILVADAETEKFKMANKTICKMLGYTNEEITTLGVEDIHPKESLSLIKEKFGQMIRGEIQNALNLPVKRKDGSIFYADISVSPSLIRGKKYFAGFFRDATGRREIEKSMKRFELLYQSSADAIMTLEPPEWKFTSGNPTALKMFNVGNEPEFVKLGPWDLSPKKQPDGSMSSVKAKEMIDKAMRDGSSYFEWMHKRYEGENFPTTVLLSKIKLGDREFLQATVRDISERKKAEEKLLFFQKSVEGSSDAIGMSTPEGKHFYQNEAFDKMFGVSAEKIEKEGGASSRLYADKQEGQKVFETLIGGGSWTGEIKMIGANGKEIFVFLRAYSVKNEKGEVVGLVGVHTDITQKKKTEEALNEKMLEADRLNKITIGRELKMVELKKELARLKGGKA